MAEGYLIGPNLLGDIRRTIAAVDGQELEQTPTRIETRFEDVQYPQQKIFRIGTFTGAWSLNASNVVTLPVTGSTSVTTVTATNLFADIQTSTSSTRSVGISKDGTAWYMSAWPERDRILKGTFSAPWTKGSSKSVSSSGATYTATNYFGAITVSGTKNCAIAWVGSEWILIAAECV